MINVVNSSGTLATNKMPFIIHGWNKIDRGTDNDRLFVVTKKIGSSESIVYPGKVSQSSTYTPRYAWSFASKMVLANIPRYYPSNKIIEGQTTGNQLSAYGGFCAIPYQPLSEVWKDPNRYSSAASQILSIDDTPWHYSTLGWSVSQMLGIQLDIKAAMDLLSIATGGKLTIQFSMFATYHGGDNKLRTADDQAGVLIDGAVGQTGGGGGFYDTVKLMCKYEVPVYDYDKRLYETNFGLIACENQTIYTASRLNNLTSYWINIIPVFTTYYTSSTSESDIPTQFCCCVQISEGT